MSSLLGFQSPWQTCTLSVLCIDRLFGSFQFEVDLHQLIFLGHILGEGLGEALLVPGEGGVEDHDVYAADVDAVDVDVVDVEHLGAHVCTSFPRPVSRLSTTAEQERGIIALCVATKLRSSVSKSKKPMSIPSSCPSQHQLELSTDRY